MDSGISSVSKTDDFSIVRTDSEFLSAVADDADTDICLSELTLLPELSELSEFETVPMPQPQSRPYNIQIQKIDCTNFFKTIPPV